jgi:transcription-repair coupling factor (superfamily II helicase)
MGRNHACTCKVSIEKLQEHFAAVGMARVSQVSGAGQFSVRGGIVYYLKWGETSISKLDFFGDIIESMKEIPLDSDLAERSPHPQDRPLT